MGKKRKRGDASRDAMESTQPSNTFGIGNTLSLLREPPAAPRVAKPHQGGAESDIAENCPDSEPGKKKKNKAGKEKVKYPSLTYINGQMQNPIKISDMQGLLLYCFADGLSPQWISVKHSGHIRKAVVVMVPGLETGMFDGSVKLTGPQAPSTNTDVESPESVEQPTEFELWKKGVPLDRTLNRSNPKSLLNEELPDALQPLSEIFPHIWPVRSPGDTKYNKLHSPLQAFLMSALQKSGKDSNNGPGPRPPRHQSWASKQAPVTTFITSPQDLREGDYVLHPALFDTVNEKDAYADIRRRTEQSVEHGWVDTNISHVEDAIVPENQIQTGSITVGRRVLALDCEMCITEGGKSELTRISMVGWDGEIILDEFVKPERPVIDYLTQYSGVTKEILDPITTTLDDIQKRLLNILTPNCILVGHSLNSDLNALKLTHPFIIDTALLYPHPRGPPLRSSLKWLVQKYLGREIQKGQAGHDSIEDARAVLDLLKQKCEKGERWGTSDCSNESIFRRLSRASKDHRAGRAAEGEGRTGAVVDWGNPDRGFGAQASVALGCQNDEEVVAALSKAVNGDADGLPVPPGGVDFTWARLRELEVFRGWCNRVPGTSNSYDSSSVAVQPSPAAVDPDTLGSTVAKTVSYIKRIYDSLPPYTLFMVYSGTGDPREVVRLQAMHKTYLEEFRSRKPWDQLTVKWTDTEEQALKKALQFARDGCGFLTVK
ncbi:hypothetical protein LOZ58_003860 [Ophidiomyces ophidiicola]|nr:hypothetical protein LOZ65_005254 [Ophidiomyces ophidiicola]KAI1960787.1 hypothetical protein LOZ58_003860 [Ophidiomyces ophidiicola]